MSDTTRNNGRTSDGKFGKGNQCAKKDFTKEMAQHITSQELYWASRIITEKSAKDLKRMAADGTLGDESLLTYSIISKASKGDFKPMQFLIEMILGRPRQQHEVQQNSKIELNVDKEDLSL
jgi:hypothetical protein